MKINKGLKCIKNKQKRVKFPLKRGFNGNDITQLTSVMKTPR